MMHDYDRTNTVRTHRADGRLRAYREGDEHVIESKGREPRDQWTKRVPAERTVVDAGDRLWTIPDNWVHKLGIDGVAERTYAIYQIPETGADVLVTVPNKVHLVDAWYGVRAVGTMTVSYDDECDWDELRRGIDKLHDSEDAPQMAIQALEELDDRRDEFEAMLADLVDEYAHEALMDRLGGGTIDGWTTEPWGDHRFQWQPIVRDIVSDEAPEDVVDEVIEILQWRSVVPNYPTVRVDVE
jgi:hypothetical protein